MWWILFNLLPTSILTRPRLEHKLNSWKVRSVNPVTASVLSLVMVSVLKSFHDSRLLSKQWLSNKMARKSGSQNGSGQHVISCQLVGWIWSKRILAREVYCASWLPRQPASESASKRPRQVSRSLSHVRTVGSVRKGGCHVVWHAPVIKAMWYGLPQQHGLPLQPVLLMRQPD